jgi:dihydrofolate synthase/folylpolyglutamate synthase
MALALMAAAQVEPGLSPETAALGLARSGLPARFQILPGEPPVILDGAHTPNSVRLSLESLETIFPGRKHLLFACAHDKHHAQMAEILAGRFERITVTRPGTFKQSEPEAVFRSFVSRNASTALVEDTGEAVRKAREAAASEGATLLVAGSFYLCSEAAQILER